MGKNSNFFDLPPEVMTTLGTVLGFAFLGDLTSAQQNSLGNFLMLIAQVIQTTAAQRQLFEDKQSNNTILKMQSDIDALKKSSNDTISKMPSDTDALKKT